ncbi:MAG: S1 family peptidase [Burkholderiaceae bacterium]|nr:S1 family peptidase [Burkholderiaceae bacterium]
MAKPLTQWSAADQSAGQKAADAWQKFFQSQRQDAVAGAETIYASARIMEAQQRRELELLQLPNVVGVAPSLKVTGGKPTDRWSLTVLVEKKLPKNKLGREDVVPATLDGVVTDVVETGRIEALAFNARVQPALPGFSIGHHDITAGTFGCLVRDLRAASPASASTAESEGDYLILSNNHVLARSNAARPGDLILQPGPFDGGVYPSDAIARLDRFEPIVFGASGFNLVDAAVARPLFSRGVTSALIGLAMPNGIAQAFPGALVIKVGRTTEVTVGRVLATNATVVVGFGSGLAVFRHQILTTAMAAGGDSGSLLMDANLNAVGLLFAGSAFVTVHNHIANVEAALGVRPLTASRAG